MQSKWKWNSYTYFDEDGIYKNFCQTKDSFIFRVNKVILGQTYAFIPSKFACTKFTVFGILPIFIPVYLVCLSFCVLKAHFLSGSCRKWKHFDFHIWSSLRKHLKNIEEMSSAGTGRGGLPKPSPASAASMPSSTMSLRYAHCPLSPKITRNCQKVSNPCMIKCPTWSA